MSNIQSGISLTRLFSENVFRIPDYQRGYAWTERQLNELWLDIEDVVMLPNGEFQKHFTGTVFLESIAAPDEDSWLLDQHYYAVVDGQQRLTTLVILMFELWKRLDDSFEYKEVMRRTFLVAEDKKKINKVYRFSYIGENEKFLQKVIFEDDTVRGSVGHETVYTRNLLAAKKFFAERIDKLRGPERESLYKKLITSLRFDFRPIEDLDVQAVFETMNNRGKPLTVLEKLKNRLMYLADKLNVEDAHKRKLRGEIRDAWGEVYRKLGQNPNMILDEDEFISAHLSLYRTPQEPTFSARQAEKKLFEMFSTRAESYPFANDNEVRESKVTYEKIEKYISDVDLFSAEWFAIHNTQEQLEQKILRLNQTKELKIFLCSLRLRASSKDVLNEAWKLTERTLFRNRVPGAAFKDEGTFATLARNLYDRELTIEEVVLQLKSDLEVAKINPANIAHGFAGLFDYQRGNKGFHRWSALKYFLFEYEAFRRKEVKEYNDIVTLKDYEETSIEHILPQNWTANWRQIVCEFSQRVSKDMDKGTGYSEKVIVNTLGNLMLIRKQKNSSLHDDPWEKKVCRYKTGTYNEREVADNSEWTSVEIDARGVKLLKFLVQKLEMDAGSFAQNLQDQMLYNNMYIATAMRT